MSSPNFLEEGLLWDDLIDNLREYFQISIGFIIATFAIHNYIGTSMKTLIISGILFIVVIFFGNYIFKFFEIVTNYLNEYSLSFNELKLSENVIIYGVLSLFCILFICVVLYVASMLISEWRNGEKQQKQDILSLAEKGQSKHKNGKKKQQQGILSDEDKDYNKRVSEKGQTILTAVEMNGNSNGNQLTI